jgi:hypothetical protein
MRGALLVTAVALLSLAACGGAAQEARAPDLSCIDEPATETFERGCGASVMIAARDSAKSCRKDSGPSGKTHVKVTWLPDGTVESVVLDEDTPIKGTDVERCIIAKFQKQRTRKFTSDKPVSVGIVVTVD